MITRAIFAAVLVLANGPAVAQESAFEIFDHEVLLGPLNDVLSGNLEDGFVPFAHAVWPDGSVMVLTCRADGAGQIVVMLPPRENGERYGLWYEAHAGFCTRPGEPL